MVVFTPEEERDVNAILEAALVYGISQTAQRVVNLRTKRREMVNEAAVRRTLCDHARIIIGRLETAGGVHFEARVAQIASPMQDGR